MHAKREMRAFHFRQSMNASLVLITLSVLLFVCGASNPTIGSTLLPVVPGAYAGERSMSGSPTNSPHNAISSNTMYIGVDDAGTGGIICTDARARQAFEDIGFDYYSFQFTGDPSLERAEQTIQPLIDWAQANKHSFLVNLDAATRDKGDPSIYRNPGFFVQPTPGCVQKCLSSPWFLGFSYDELDHCINDGGWMTIHTGAYAPCFYDAKGGSLYDAYMGNLHNLRILMQRSYPGFAENGRSGSTGPVVNGEYVFPVLYHLMARAGIVPTPKYLMEGFTPVNVAMGMGAAKQYGLRFWSHIDLWGKNLIYPGHTPDELASSLLYAYWTGAERACIENFHYKRDSLYSETTDGIELTALGEVVKDFKRDYMPANPRSIRFEDFTPDIVIIRFPDSDWGQVRAGNWMTGYLYGAPDLLADDQTHYWIKIWHVISHGTMSQHAVSFVNPSVPDPYRLMFPVNNVAVYDHLVSDRMLFQRTKLVFLTGKMISPICMEMLEQLVKQDGITVVTPTYLAPLRYNTKPENAYKSYSYGRGRWIITDDVANPEVVKLLTPYLGRSDQLRYVFGDKEVIFTSLEPGALAKVTVRKIDQNTCR